MANHIESIEVRKRRAQWARISLSRAVLATYLILLYLLFFSDAVADNHMQLINILVGAYVAVLAKSTDFWFKEKDDPETKEGEEALANGH